MFLFQTLNTILILLAQIFIQAEFNVFADIQFLRTVTEIFCCFTFFEQAKGFVLFVYKNSIRAVEWKLTI